MSCHNCHNSAKHPHRPFRHKQRGMAWSFPSLKKKDRWDIPCIEEMLRKISGVFNGIRTHELCDASAPASLRSWVWILWKTHGIFQVPIWDNRWRLSSKCDRFINSSTILHKNISFTQDISWKVEIIVSLSNHVLAKFIDNIWLYSSQAKYSCDNTNFWQPLWDS